jgi:apolipoprotein N-acyltransferase
VCVSLCFWPYRTGFLAYFVVVPFILFSGLADGRGRVLLNSLIFGFCYFFGSLYWIMLLDREQIAVPWLRLPAAVVLCLYLSVFMVFAGFASRRIGKLGIPFEIALALAWGGVEYLRSLGPLGFPWASLGYSQTPYLAVVQQAGVIGTYGISAWVILINGLVARFLMTRRTAVLLVAAVVLVGPVVGGQIALWSEQQGTTVPVALVQPNIPGSVKWSQSFRDSTMSLLAGMTYQAGDADLIIWPETAVPFHLKHSPGSIEAVTDLARRTGSHILLGFPDYEHVGEDIRFYNSATMFYPSGGVSDAYRKIHLVPFGEMIPFEDRIAALRRIDLGEGDFSPGEDYTVFEASGRKFAVAICFESIYPSLLRQFVRRGATFIVNITNDEWFGPSLGPHQHAQMAVMRAVECGVGIARCANTGISMFVDPRGRVTSKTGLFTRQVLVGRVEAGEADTPYLKVGPVLETGMLMAVLALIGASYLVRRQAGERRRP